MAAWKLAPAFAAGNCSVLKPASPTPWSILKLAEVIGDVLPPGVLNIVNGPGAEIGKALATNRRIAKIAFTGETTTGRLIMQYAAQNIIPSTTELGGKSPNIFFADVMAEDDDFLDKAVEGLVLYAFNKGESANQLEKITDYVEIGLAEGAELLAGGKRNIIDGDLAAGYYFEPTVFRGHNKMRIGAPTRRQESRSGAEPQERRSRAPGAEPPEEARPLVLVRRHARRHVGGLAQPEDLLLDLGHPLPADLDREIAARDHHPARRLPRERLGEQVGKGIETGSGLDLGQGRRRGPRRLRGTTRTRARSCRHGRRRRRSGTPRLRA